MPIPALAVAGITAGGGAILGALGANERNRQRTEMLKYLDDYKVGVQNDINKFNRAGERRIAAQSADIVSMSQRRGAALSANLARTGSGTLGNKLTSAVRNTGAIAKGAHEARAFPALGEAVAKQRQALRQTTLNYLSQLGPEQSMSYGALQGLTQALPGAADLYNNITTAWAT